MSIGGIVGVSIAGAVVLFVAFLLLRAALTKPKKRVIVQREEIEFDEEEFAARLSGAVRIPTVTVQGDNTDYTPFLQYHEYLEKTFPNVFAHAEKTIINGYSLVLKIDGSDKSLLPACFLSHQDVVPAPPEGWSVEPFAGEIKDGYVWGRGSLDMKWHKIALLSALDRLLAEGKTPVRGIYCCFGHDEEITGKDGAKNIAAYLLDKGVRFEYLIDEGGSVMDGAILGSEKPIAIIGVCEKGYVDYVLSSTMDGGHASNPRTASSVTTVAQAVYDLSHLPMRTKLTPPIKRMFKNVAPYMKFSYKILFANGDVLAPLLRAVLPKVSPLLNAALRTTFGFTQLCGSDAPNVIPASASAVVNVRINIGQTQEQVKKYIQKAVGKKISVTELNPGYDPTPVSNMDSDAFRVLEETIRETYGDIAVTPYPFIAATDAKHYTKLCDNIYRFGPIEMTTDDQKLIHAIDERVNIKSATKGMQFFKDFIEKTCFQEG